MQNANSYIVTFLFGIPHPFPDRDLLNNKLLLGYPHVLSTQLKSNNPRLPLFLHIAALNFDYTNTVS